MAAVDYGISNLQLLNTTFNLKKINDMERAKMMYLLHHEGEGAGPLFIRNKLAEIRGGTKMLESIFAQQRQKSRIRTHKNESKNIEAAYRTWLSDYIGIKFKDSLKYFCNPPKYLESTNKIMINIGGEAL